MRDFIQFITELTLTVTGALAAGTLVIGAIAFAIGCALFGCGWWWRGRRRKAADRSND